MIDFISVRSLFTKLLSFLARHLSQLVSVAVVGGLAPLFSLLFKFPSHDCLLMIPTLAAVLAGVVMVDQYLPKISESAIDSRHFLLGSISLLTIISFLGSIVWWIGSATSAPLQSKESSALPAFLSAEAQTSERFKTLVIRSSTSETTFFIARDRDLHLGEADVTTGLSPVVNRAIVNLVTGAGIDSSQILAEFGIKYVFLARPFNKDLVRTIDGVGGFTRASKTSEGITWKVSEALPRILFISENGERLAIPSDELEASGVLSSPGQMIVTEKFDSRWKVTLNQETIRASRSESGTPIFQIPSAGEFRIFHDSTSRRAWIALQIFAFFTLIVLTLPARRRRSDIRIEELS